jgi:hypothetical protein
MKRKLLFLLVAFAIGNSCYSQAVEQGNSLIDVTYGWPNLWTNVFKSAETTSTSTNVKTGTMGPIAIKYEYMIADKIGVGGIFNYANSSVKYDDVTQVYNSATGTYDEKIYNYKLSVPRFRVMAKFSFHYGNSDMFDGYTSIGVGYGGYSFKYDTNDPNYTSDNFDMKIAPVAIRVATGGRVYFSDNVGAIMEFGIGGGGLLEFGLTAKL